MVIGFGAAALARASLGDAEGAVALFRELADNRAIGTTINRAVQLPFWIRTLIEMQQLALAERLAAAPPSTYPSLEHALIAAHAAIAEACGDHTAALAGYTDAVQRWRAFTAVTEEAFALLGQGRCLVTLDRAAEAVPVLQQARDMFAKMGARPAGAAVESLLASAAP